MCQTKDNRKALSEHLPWTLEHSCGRVSQASFETALIIHIQHLSQGKEIFLTIKFRISFKAM